MSRQELVLFTDRPLERNADGLLRQIDDLLERGQDSRLFLAGVVEHLRDLMVTLTTQDPNRIIELPAADLEVIRNQAAKSGVDRLLFLDLIGEVVNTVQARLAQDLERRLTQQVTTEVQAAVAAPLVDIRQDIANAVADAVAEALARRPNR